MAGLGTRDNRGPDRPYIITYERGERKLYDSARSLDDAKLRIAIRLAKRHNRGEVANVYLRHELVFSSRRAV